MDRFLALQANLFGMNMWVGEYINNSHKNGWVRKGGREFGGIANGKSLIRDS
jgi:hypothetical protein